MKLYLLRHGHSPSPAQAAVASDAERPLSEEGRKAVEANVARLSRLGAKPALILHSPLKRAAQTAQAAARVLGLEKSLKTFAPLANVLPASEVRAAIEADAACRVPELLLVGHQPQLGELAALLSGQVFELKTGGIIALDAPEKGRAKVLWNANPGDPNPR